MLATLSFLTIAVSFQEPADIASRLLPKLGKTLGIRLEADRRMGPQVLQIRSSRLTQETLLAKIAEVSGGEWEKVTGGYRLTLSNSRLNALWKQEAAEREPWIRKALESRADGDQSLAVRTALQWVGARELSTIRPGERRIWRTVPRNGELLLDPSVAKAMAGYRESRNQAAEKHVQLGGSDPYRTVRSTPAAAVRFSVHHNLADGGITGCLSAEGEAGNVLEIATDAIYQEAVPVPESVTKPFPLTPVPFSPAAFANADVVNRDDYVKSENLAAYLHPEKNEPLHFAFGEAFKELAVALSVDLVAFLDDKLFLNAKHFRQVGISKKLASSLLFGGNEMKFDGDVATLRPRALASAIETRVDRTLLRSRIAEVEQNGHLNFLFAKPIGLEERYLTSLSPSTYDDLNYVDSPWGIPSFWMSMNSDLRARIMSEEMKLSGDHPEVRRLFNSFFSDSAAIDKESIDAHGSFIYQPVKTLRLAATSVPKSIIFVRTEPKGLLKTYSAESLATVLKRPELSRSLLARDCAFFTGVRIETTLKFRVEFEKSKWENEFRFPQYRRTTDRPMTLDQIRQLLPKG